MCFTFNIHSLQCAAVAICLACKSLGAVIELCGHKTSLSTGAIRQKDISLNVVKLNMAPVIRTWNVLFRFGDFLCKPFETGHVLCM